MDMKRTKERGNEAQLPKNTDIFVEAKLSMAENAESTDEAKDAENSVSSATNKMAKDGKKMENNVLAEVENSAEKKEDAENLKEMPTNGVENVENMASKDVASAENMNAEEEGDLESANLAENNENSENDENVNKKTSVMLGVDKTKDKANKTKNKQTEDRVKKAEDRAKRKAEKVKLREEKKAKIDKTARRKKFFITLYVLAFLAVLGVVAGVICFYLVTPDIDKTPENVRVERYDGDFFVVCDYQDKFEYQFVVEEEIDGKYVTVISASSPINTFSLSESNIVLGAGSKFRIKVAFINENGARGDYSKEIEWTRMVSLDKPNARVDGNVVSWDAVDFAEGYYLKIIRNDVCDNFDVGNALSYTLTGSGTYQIYVVATAGDGFYFSSSDQLTVEL